MKAYNKWNYYSSYTIFIFKCSINGIKTVFPLNLIWKNTTNCCAFVNFIVSFLVVQVIDTSHETTLNIDATSISEYKNLVCNKDCVSGTVLPPLTFINRISSVSEIEYLKKKVNLKHLTNHLK